MEERLSQDQLNILRSAIRRGIALPEAERELYATNSYALLKMSDVYLDTCYLLADECAAELSLYEPDIHDRWRDDVAEEIQWWWAWVQKLRDEDKLQAWATFASSPFPFERYVDQFAKTGPVRVLNLGSGPRSTMGSSSQIGDRLEITNMDPLAAAYNKLMHLLGAPGTGDIVFGAVEFLSKLDLPKYSVIAATNCLDHAYDVPRGMGELIHCLDDQGLIQLRHFENEGEAQNYMGLHQWNIEIKDEQVHLWTRERSHLFDHAAHGLDLSYDRVVVKKGTGAEHPQLTIRLSRGLDLASAGASTAAELASQ